MKKTYFTAGLLSALILSPTALQAFANTNVSTVLEDTMILSTLNSSPESNELLAKAALPKPLDFKSAKIGSVISTLTDSQGAKHQITLQEISKDTTFNNRFKVVYRIDVNRSTSRDRVYRVNFFKEAGTKVEDYGRCQSVLTGSATAIQFTCYVDQEDFNDQKSLYVSVGVTKNANDKETFAQALHKTTHPLYQSITSAKLRSFTVNTPSGMSGSSVKFEATTIAGTEARYRFQILQDGVWNTIQDFSSKAYLNYTLPSPMDGTSSESATIRVLTKHTASKNEYDDSSTLVVKGNGTPNEDTELTSKLNQLKESNGVLTFDGYGYIPGVQVSSEKEAGFKLLFYGNDFSKHFYDLTPVYNSSMTTSSVHGNNGINYDYASFQLKSDLSKLPLGEYDIYMYKDILTGSKYLKLQTPLSIHSKLEDFYYIKDGKKFTFLRTNSAGVSTYRLVVTATDYRDLEATPIAGNNVKRVSKFSIVNGKIDIEGYSYAQNIDIPNSKDVIKKLKFTDVNTGKQVKTYSIPNVYMTSISKDPNHGAGIYNYNWAKFAGTLDISDLPMGEYYLKIYTNAKDNKYDEVITFHSSIGDFSFTANGKVYQFERVKAYGVSSLKLTVKSTKSLEEVSLLVEDSVLTDNELISEEVTEGPMIDLEVTDETLDDTNLPTDDSIDQDLTEVESEKETTPEVETPEITPEEPTTSDSLTEEVEAATEESVIQDSEFTSEEL